MAWQHGNNKYHRHYLMKDLLGHILNFSQITNINYTLYHMDRSKESFNYEIDSYKKIRLS